MPYANDGFWFDLYQAQRVVATNGIPASASHFASIGVVLNILCILLMIPFICKMPENARDDNFLVSPNAIRLGYTALLNIAVLLLDTVFVIIPSSYLSDKLEFPGLEFTSLDSYSYSQWKHISLYLFLMIIAEAFRIAAQLKQENDLTN